MPLIWCAYPWFKFWHFTYDSHRYCAVTHLSLNRYSNTEYVKNKNPNRSKYSHSNLEHEEHTQKSEKLQEVEPKNNIQHKPNPWADRPTRKTKEKRKKENKIKTRYFKPRNMNLAQIKYFSNLEHKHSWPIDVGLILLPITLQNHWSAPKLHQNITNFLIVSIDQIPNTHKKEAFLFIYLMLGSNQGKFVEWRWAYNTLDPHSKSRRKIQNSNLCSLKMLEMYALYHLNNIEITS